MRLRSLWNLRYPPGGLKDVTQLPAALQDALASFIREVAKEEVAKAHAQSIPGEYLTTREAAALAKVTQGTIRRWIRIGDLQVHRAGRTLRIERDELQAMMKPGRRRPKSVDHLMTPEDLAARDFS